MSDESMTSEDLYNLGRRQALADLKHREIPRRRAYCYRMRRSDPEAVRVSLLVLKGLSDWAREQLDAIPTLTTKKSANTKETER